MEKQFRIFKSFKTAEKITLPNSNIIEIGTLIGPGEEILLQHFSKAVIKKLVESGHLGVDGKIPEENGTGKSYKDGTPVIFTREFLDGLISPKSLNRAVQLISEKKLGKEELLILKGKIEEVLDSGITQPTLNLLHDNIILQLYNSEIINAS